jgi:CRISPR/Cas system CMR subunit Cmr6 (Cas7 group RAMP superfamily)
MPPVLPKDTTDVLGPHARNCDSRSLKLDRLADPREKEEARKQFFKTACDTPPWRGKSPSWTNLLIHTFRANGAVLRYAQIQSRLMLNMAGGVMENAGLCLDRFGLPYIPGSAVKGCARRAALAALREWSEAGQKPGATPQDDGNLFKEACAPFVTPADMLAAIGRVFGWCEQDWKDDADFAWAFSAGTGDTWVSVRNDVVRRLALDPGSALDPGDKTPWKRLPNFAGSIAFLPAYPIDLEQTGPVPGLPVPVPSLGKLELDVVTCHHRDYYASKEANPVATDTEDPVPVVFPAVAPGHIFGFVLAPLRDSSPAHLSQADTWLACGLAAFGLGAKTNAGYGWFDSTRPVQEAVERGLAAAEARRQSQLTQQRQEQERRAEEARRQSEAAETKSATANMTAEQKADYEVARLSSDQFRSHLDSFAKRARSEQEAVVRAMRLPPEHPASRRTFWEDLKAKAQRGGKPAQISDAIRQISKQILPGKEGKMP